MNIAGFEPLSSSVGFLVNLLARQMRTELERRLQPVHLSPTHWSVLMVLLEEDLLSQTDIAARAGLDGATTTRTLDLLEARELINRNRDDNDRRVQIIALTEPGRAMAMEVAQVGAEINREVLALLPARNRSQLPQILADLVAKMPALTEERSLNELAEQSRKSL